MRAWICGLLLAAACGGEESPTPARLEAPPLDGFLQILPEGASVTMRLPSPRAVEAQPDAYAALIRALGWKESPQMVFFRTENGVGLATDRAPGLALTAGGARVHYLPAADKGALNQALRPLPRTVALQEQNSWIVLSEGGKGVGNASEGPLPAGDIALRVRHNSLLASLAHAGDSLEVGLRLGGAGVEFEATLTPGANSPTREWLAQARPDEGGLLEYLPSSLALRVETTLPTTFLSTAITRRLVRHTGVKDPADVVLVERFLREVMTGADPATGLALGIEFRDGRASVVALGRSATGPDSPILAKLRRDDRTSFGALVFDAREAPAGLRGWSVWVAQAEPNLDGCPECAWPAVGEIVDEEQGLSVAYVTHDGWSILAAGPRADLLVRFVRSKVAYGANRSVGSFELLRMRERGSGDYVLGAVLAGQGLEGMPEEDRKALRALVGATPAAQAPASLAIAGFTDGQKLSLVGRARY